MPIWTECHGDRHGLFCLFRSAKVQTFCRNCNSKENALSYRLLTPTAKHVAIAAVRTHGRAARAPGKRASGDGCHGRLVGRIQVVAEGVPAQRLPVAAFEVVLHRVAVSVPTHAYYLRCRHMQIIIGYLSA